MSKQKTPPVADRGFQEMEVVRGQATPEAEEFLSFVEFWRRSAGRTAEIAGAGGGEQGGAAASGSAGGGFTSASFPAASTGEDADSEQGGANPAPATEEPAEPPPPDERELARREAEEILRAAREEADRLKEEAQKRGLAAGERQARQEAQKEYGQRIANLDQALKTLAGQRGAIIERYRRELLTLVTTISERLVSHEVATNPAVIESCFRRAMEFVVENSLVKAHLNPDDFHSLKEAGLADPSLFGGKNRVQLIEDPAISPGGCLLKSDFGEIDATLENCRDKLYQAVDQAFQAALARADLAAEEQVEVVPYKAEAPPESLVEPEPRDDPASPGETQPDSEPAPDSTEPQDR